MTKIFFLKMFSAKVNKMVNKTKDKNSIFKDDLLRVLDEIEECIKSSNN